MIIDFPPFVQARPRLGRHGNVYDPSGGKKKDLAYALLIARQRANSAILDGDLFLDVTFFVKGRRGDLDNFIKAFCDAANGVLWRDDSQVARIFAMVQRNASIEQIHYELYPMQ